MQPLGPNPNPQIELMPVELALILVLGSYVIGVLMGLLWERGKWLAAADRSRWHECAGRLYRVEREEDRGKRLADQYFEDEA